MTIPLTIQKEIAAVAYRLASAYHGASDELYEHPNQDPRQAELLYVLSDAVEQLRKFFPDVESDGSAAPSEQPSGERGNDHGPR